MKHVSEFGCVKNTYNNWIFPEINNTRFYVKVSQSHDIVGKNLSSKKISGRVFLFPGPAWSVWKKFVAGGSLLFVLFFVSRNFVCSGWAAIRLATAISC